jgi:hypothetical protein
MTTLESNQLSYFFLSFLQKKFQWFCQNFVRRKEKSILADAEAFSRMTLMQIDM